MAENNVLGWLKIASHLDVARAIENSPKTAKEIEKMVGREETKVAEILEHLETSQAAQYTGTGWVLSELGKKVLAKYFK